MTENSGHNYITNKELLLEMRDDIKSVKDEQADLRAWIQAEFGKRPTRAEIIGWFSGLGVVAGIIIAILNRPPA